MSEVWKEAPDSGSGPERWVGREWGGDSGRNDSGFQCSELNTLGPKPLNPLDNLSWWQIEKN